LEHYYHCSDCYWICPLVLFYFWFSPWCDSDTYIHAKFVFATFIAGVYVHKNMECLRMTEKSSSIQNWNRIFNLCI